MTTDTEGGGYHPTPASVDPTEPDHFAEAKGDSYVYTPTAQYEYRRGYAQGIEDAARELEIDRPSVVPFRLWNQIVDDIRALSPAPSPKREEGGK